MESVVPQRLILVQREPDVVDRLIIQLGPEQRTVNPLSGFVARCHRGVNRMRCQAWVWLAKRIVTGIKGIKGVSDNFFIVQASLAPAALP